MAMGAVRAMLPDHIFLDPRHRERTGRLHDRARVFENVLDGGANLVGSDQYDFVDILPGQPKWLLSHAFDGDTVGKLAHAVERDPLAGAQRLIHARRVFGFYADDPDPRRERLRVCGDTGNQSAAPHWNENSVDGIAMMLAQDFHGDGALPRDHIGIVERMHEN
jgi:hypothetical protein